MNILIINHYAGSPEMGMEFRPYYLAREWVKLGHNVTIIGSNYSHLRSSQPKSDKDLDEEYIEGIRYLWLNTPKYDSSGIKRVFNMLTFVCKLFIYKNKIIKKINPNVVIASSTYPLDIYPAFKIAKKKNSKLVFELHDMWPLSPMLIGGYSKYHPFIWIMQKAENFACRNSDGYISMLGNAEEYLIEHGLKPGKFTHITNGFHEDDWMNNDEEIPSEHTALFKQLKNENNDIIGYAGGHGPSNALKCFIHAATKFSKYDKVAFVLVGDGPEKRELEKIVEEKKFSHIYFLPPVLKKAIPALLNNFDILYAGGTKSILHSYGTSYNKITDYMLAAKPIIFAVDEPNSLVERVKCGVQIPAENEEEIIKVIKHFLELSLEDRNKMGERGRDYAIKELNYTSLAKKFIDAINRY